MDWGDVADEDDMLPTRVVQHFGLGEIVVCSNAGYFLQGDNIIDRKVYRLSPQEPDGSIVTETTLREILQRDGDDDVYWKPLEWKHLQMVVDSDGGQEERFKLLSEILQRKVDAKLSEMTFIPYGDSFADSDFVDSF